MPRRTSSLRVRSASIRPRRRLITPLLEELVAQRDQLARRLNGRGAGQVVHHDLCARLAAVGRARGHLEHVAPLRERHERAEAAVGVLHQLGGVPV